jgi:hypothetical protein
MNKPFILLACFILIGSLFAEDLVITKGGFGELTSAKLANYSYLIKDKTGTALLKDTVKNNIDAKNFLTDCQGNLICDYRIEIDAKQALVFDTDTLKGAYDGEMISIQKIFYETTFNQTKESCMIEMGNITTCKNITTTTINENADITKPFAKDEIRTYTIRFVKRIAINSDGTMTNPIVDIYHIIYGQERKDAALWNSTGGTVTYDGNYTVVTFLTNGTFNVTGEINATVLVVGGGGAGRSSAGADQSGGGGHSGNLIYNLSANLMGTNTVIIGGGGQPVASNNGNPGYTSSMGAYTASGGLGGSTISSVSCPAIYGGNGTATAGLPGITGVGGVGGNGIAYTINGTSVYYGGGGGGGCSVGGAGGLGGGGKGSNYNANNGLAGTANTGGGGGGASSGGGSVAYAGGSGIVIIRYLTYIDPIPSIIISTNLSSPGNASYKGTSNISHIFSVNQSTTTNVTVKFYLDGG